MKPIRNLSVNALVWALGWTLMWGAQENTKAATYRAGDIIENFTLTDRATRKPVKLSDLEGKIVFLEWFAWWCPFCQAAAPQVEAGIVQWYGSRNGNPAGIPVMHVAVNLQPNQETQTQNFLNRAGFKFVLEDFNRALANRFQSGGQPIFAVINGVTNSPSHKPWELLIHQDGYGQRDFSESLVRFRAAIDRVQGAPALPTPPTISQQPAATSVLEGASFTLSVIATGDEPLRYQWSRDGNTIPGATLATWIVAVAQASDAGTYTVQVSNDAGSVISNPATVVVRYRPVISTQPEAVSVLEGDSFTLAVVATGSEPLRYQWQRDGGAIPGATQATWTVAAAQAADAGTYTVQVSNDDGSVVSHPAKVVVQARPVPVPHLSRIARTPDGRIAIEVVNAGGRAPVLEFSSDLVTWTRLHDLTSGVPLQQVLVAREISGGGFFRVRNQ